MPEADSCNAANSTRSALQLALEFVEEAPVSALRGNIVGGGFDHARFAKAQREKADGIVRVVVAPARRNQFPSSFATRDRIGSLWPPPSGR